MKPKSAIEKGKRYEKYIANCIVESGLDIHAGREIGSGSGKAKGDIRSTIPFLIEAKNEAGVPKWLLERVDQAKSQAEKGFYWKSRWALVVRDPRTPEGNSDDIAIIDFHELLELLKKAAAPKTKSPDRNLKYKLERLKNVTNEVIKELR